MSDSSKGKTLDEKARYAMHVWFLTFSDTLPSGAKIGIRLNYEWSGHYSANLYIQLKPEGASQSLEIPYVEPEKQVKAKTPELAMDGLIQKLEEDTSPKKAQKPVKLKKL